MLDKNGFGIDPCLCSSFYITVCGYIRRVPVSRGGSLYLHHHSFFALYPSFQHQKLSTKMEPYAINPEDQWENSRKVLGQFDAYRTAYKYIDSQPIHAVFIVPKQLPPGPRPLLVRFHGGGWVEGEAEASLRPLYAS